MAKGVLQTVTHPVTGVEEAGTVLGFNRNLNN